MCCMEQFNCMTVWNSPVVYCCSDRIVFRKLTQDWVPGNRFNTWFTSRLYTEKVNFITYNLYVHIIMFKIKTKEIYEKVSLLVCDNKYLNNRLDKWFLICSSLIMNISYSIYILFCIMFLKRSVTWLYYLFNPP